MGRSLVVWILAVCVPTPATGEPPLKRFEFSGVEMAVPIKITLYGPDSASATIAAEAAFARIRQLNAILSDYDPKSELRRLGDTSAEGAPVRVSEDLWLVLSRSQVLSERSEGAFDVTVGPVVRLWRRARRQKELPKADSLQSALKRVGYRFIRLDEKGRSVELLKPGMRLDLGGIAKGYAADEAIEVLARHGISRALVDAGGDIALGEEPPGKRGWRIGVAPLRDDGPPSRVLLLARKAVATSGDAWQSVEIAGRRYSHIVDPRTGMGLTDRFSVSVVAADCITADSLASAVSVLGPEKGIELIEATPGAAALIVRYRGGKVETYESSRFKELTTVADD